MKKTIGYIILAAAVAVSAAAQARGPAVDKILLNARSQEDLGLMDVAGGKSDLWTYGTSGAVFGRLPADVKARLEPYSVSGASFLGLYLNPYPDQAPYLSDPATDASGKAQFNPLAIRKVRYALNWLVDRQRIVDEVLAGAGTPMFAPVVPGLPNSSRFGSVAARLGMTANGNEAKALADIDAALVEAAALPELKGRLAKGRPWWTFDGQPVTLRFVMRADDPNTRLPLGRYVAGQIEKAGIKVERLEYDRTKAFATYGATDPRANQWSLYTEGLGANETKAYWEMTIAQMYAPWASVMPGGNNKELWNYRQPELDRLTQAVTGGSVKDAAEYWDKLLAATTLGMKESVRVMLAAKTSYMAAAKERFPQRMAYGVGDGIDKWSFYTADVSPETAGPDAGKKVLRMTGFSSRGALFMNSWDPIGPNGFGDTYSGMVIKELSDLELETNPATGVPMPVRATWSRTKTAGGPGQAIALPSTAVLWNAAGGRWESGVAYAKDASGQYGFATTEALSAKTEMTFSFRYGAWHHGRPVDQNDYRYALALPYDLAQRAGPADRVFDPSYASTVNPRLSRAKGYVFNKDGSITVWSDASFPMEEAQLAALVAPSLQVGAINSGAVLPWEILEAIKVLVSEGGASGTVWAYSPDASSAEVDLLSPKLVGDLKAKLGEFIQARRVPAALSGYLSADEAVKDYRLALSWLEAHGHGYISNGAFLLDRYDPAANTGVLLAFRDKSYPFEPGYWTKALQGSFTRIDSVRAAEPGTVKELAVTVAVSEVAYPANTASPAKSARVSVSLVLGDRTERLEARQVKAGTYEARVPAALVDSLPPGAWSVVAESSLGKSDAPGVGSTSIFKF